MDVVITTNSPGEVSAWVRPVVRQLRALPEQQDFRITVFVLPCTFASGAEKAVVEGIPGVDCVYGPHASLRYILLGRPPAGFNPGSKGVVVFLGGDLVLGAWLARRTGFPALAYTEGQAHAAGMYQRFFASDGRARMRLLQRGVPAEKITVVGDLMADAVEPRWEPAEFLRALGLNPERPVVAIFPGSRSREVSHILPFFLKAADLIAASLPQVQFLCSVSPFVSAEQIAEAARRSSRALEGATARLIPASLAFPEGETPAYLHSCREDGGSPEVLGRAAGWLLETEAGTRVVAVQGAQYDVMAAADLAITIPGTNTAEMAYLGLPMVTVLPLNRPEDIPLEGLLEVFGRLPLIGRYLKRRAVKQAAERIPFVALPNRKLGQEVVPEVRGVLRPTDVAVPVVSLLSNPQRLQAVAKRLQALAGERGAAERLAEAVSRAARPQPGASRQEESELE